MEKYVTVLGDTWDAVAKKVYGDERAADLLMRANPQKIMTLMFSDGEELTVPKREADTRKTVASDAAMWREVMNG